MRILFINSVVDIGSTGKIVRHLSNELKKYGHETLICYGRSRIEPSDDTFYFGNTLSTFYHGLMTRIFGRNGLHSNRKTNELIEEIKRFKPDLIHLHNIHGYYLNVPKLMDFLKALDVKIVWTLHDCWTFSGSSAYFDFSGCKTWDEGCVECNITNEYPQAVLFPNQKRNFKWKKDSFSGFKDMNLVTPSLWLRDLVRTTFLNQYPVKCIYNGIDLNVFTPTNKPKNFDKIKLLGVANIWEKRKGLEDFLALSELLDDRYEITLVGLSKKQIKKLPKNIIGISRTKNIDELVKLYSESHIYLNLSVEETLGMTTIESLACGTPCIVYDATAVPEVVNLSTGIIVEKNNIDELRNQIINFDFDKYTLESCLKRSEDFSLENMISENMEGYKL